MSRATVGGGPRRASVWRALAAIGLLLPGLGCASFNPLAAFGHDESDPMVVEMRRLEAEQRRMASENRISEEAEARRRAENPETMADKLARGDKHLDSGELAAALWDYASAHRMDPTAAAPRVRLGYVHLRHDPERARPIFESVLEREPEEVSAHIGLGLALLSNDERKAGLRHLERAVELAPNSPKAHGALGVSLDQLGSHEKAVFHLERARELQPRNSRILNNLGVAYLRAGRPEDAEPALRAALREDTRDEALRSNNLGMALAMQGRFEQALEAFRRGGDEQSALSNLGYVHYLRGEYGAAIRHYERALVVGGEQDVQVVRNLEVAREAQRAGLASRVAPAMPGRGAAPVAGREDAETDAAPVAERPGAGADSEVARGGAVEEAGAAEPAVASDDPWFWSAPPGSLAD